MRRGGAKRRQNKTQAPINGWRGEYRNPQKRAPKTKTRSEARAKRKITQKDHLKNILRCATTRKRRIRASTHNDERKGKKNLKNKRKPTKCRQSKRAGRPEAPKRVHKTMQRCSEKQAGV